MKAVRGIVACLLACVLFAGTAEARHHHHHRHHHRHSPVISRVVARTQNDTERPADCYGIAWCGCWLRHQFGIASKALNLADNWRRIGEPATPDNANIVVWPNHHHVGKVLERKTGKVLVISGNSRHGHVYTGWVKINGRFTFRKL